jgi:hypothetical protein
LAFNLFEFLASFAGCVAGLTEFCQLASVEWRAYGLFSRLTGRRTQGLSLNMPSSSKPAKTFMRTAKNTFQKLFFNKT